MVSKRIIHVIIGGSAVLVVRNMPTDNIIILTSYNGNQPLATFICDKRKCKLPAKQSRVAPNRQNKHAYKLFSHLDILETLGGSTVQKVL